MAITRWQPDRTSPLPPWPVPTVGTALARGLLGRCPACGKTHLFAGFLRVVNECANCHAPLGSARADDAPPYFVTLISGHIIIPAMLVTQKLANPSNLALTLVFVPLTVVLALGLLRPVKGGVLAVMVAMGMLEPTPTTE
ncbi:MAG TPA: DUF983 domain-containing protein [Acetobacteraceae bacterium]|jgi:uncharacterized protein (DUF983 family)|nr:DUF983 domain-containing protein [Acetobacteraceae bacterium]